MMNDPDYGYHTSRTPPEADLILAILGRAILDLFGSANLNSHPEEKVAVRRDALLFLTESFGPWARRRAELCDAVGINSDEMRKRVVQVLEGDDMGLAEFDARKQLTHIDDARKLWTEHKNRAHTKPILRRRPSSKAAPPRAKIGKYVEVRGCIMRLLADKPHTFKALVIATDGDLSEDAMRKVLRNGLAKGELVQDKTWEYRLAPQTSLAAEAA